MKKTLSMILLLALFMPGLNNVYAQTNANKKVLFYLKTDVKPKEETKAVAAKVQPASSEQSEDETVYTTVEKMPEFPGGQQAMTRYLTENLKYPVIAQENGIQGTAICQYVVNKDGSTSDVKIVKSAGDPSLDKEAIRLIKAMPKWNPGKQNGKTVRVQCTTMVKFKLY